MPARVRRPDPSNRIAIEITVAELARACGWSRQTTLRRLVAEGDIPLRRRGTGGKRVHWALSVADLVGSELRWVKAAIDWRKLLLERAPRPDDQDEDGEDDD